MVVDGIILAVILAYLRGGSFKAFDEVKLRGVKFIIGLFIVQMILLILSPRVAWLGNTLPYWVNLFSVGFLLLVIVNRKISGFHLIALGIFLNLLVMIVNGGKMPVSLDAASMVFPDQVQQLYANGLKHVVMKDGSFLWFLGDIIPLPSPYPVEKVISIGDVLINVGGFMFIWKTMLHIKRIKNENIGGEVL